MIRSLDRRGKRIIFTLDDANRFYIHLGMSGRLTIESAGAPVPPHTHFILEFDSLRGMGVSPMFSSKSHGRDGHATSKSHLRFKDPRRFGGIWWLGQNTNDADLGPEPFTLRPQALHERLRKTKRPIKSALLDQR